jgi:uracil-DNA glycosylase
MNNDKLNEALIEIVHSDILNISKNEIKFLYDAWLNGRSSIGKWIQRKEVINEKQNVPNNACLRGVDLPFYFGNYHTSKKRIMIIGLDPLRNKSAFENAKKAEVSADIYNDVLLSTPYALHSKNVREGKTNNYWQIISNLEKQNFIYLTDLYKSFFRVEIDFKDVRSYDYYRKKDVSNNSKEILLKEIDLVDPDIIIAFGNDTFGKLLEAIEEVNNESLNKIPILKFIHPAARYKNLIEFLKKNGIDTISIKTKKDYGVAFSELIKYHLEK